MSESPAQNTDRELFREDTGISAGSYYENSVHVTQDGLIGMNVGGTVYVMSVEDWVNLARENYMDWREKQRRQDRVAQDRWATGPEF